MMRPTFFVTFVIAAGLLGGCGSGGGGSGGGSPAATGPPPPAPGVTVSPSSLTVEEGAQTTYTIVLQAAPTGNVTVTPASSDANAATVTEALTFTTGNWGTAQTVTVTGVEEDVNDASDESVTVTHAVSGYGSVTTAASVTVTVTDNDLSASGIFVSGRDPDGIEAWMVGLMQAAVVALFNELIREFAQFELGELNIALRNLEQIVLGVLQDREPDEIEALFDAFVDALEALDAFEPGELETLRGETEELIAELEADFEEFKAELLLALDALKDVLGEGYGLGVHGLENFSPTGVFVLQGSRILGVDLALGELFGSTVRVDGANVAGEARRLPVFSANTVASTFSGTVVENESVRLVFKDDDGDEVSLDLVLDDIYNHPSSLSSWQGNWVLTEDGVSTQSMTVDAAGTLLRQDADGCTATGRIAIIDPDRNLYNVEMDVTSCDVDDGRHYGFAFLGNAASGGENNRGALVVVHAGNEPDTAMSSVFFRR